MNRHNLVSPLTLAFAIAMLLIAGVACSGSRQKVRKSKELNRFVETYQYVPFNIPRDGDGVGTLISFDGGREAVEATQDECFGANTISIDTLRASVAEYDYTYSKSDSALIDSGRIFGDKVNLSSAFADTRVDSVKVNFSNVFEVRLTRLSVERQIENIIAGDPLCARKILDQNTYLIERTLGAEKTTVSFLTSGSRQLDVDANILSEIKANSDFVRTVDGRNVLSFEEPRIIGYRLWNIKGDPGMANTPSEITPVSIDEIIRLKQGDQ